VLVFPPVGADPDLSTKEPSAVRAPRGPAAPECSDRIPSIPYLSHLSHLAFPFGHRFVTMLCRLPWKVDSSSNAKESTKEGSRRRKEGRQYSNDAARQFHSFPHQSRPRSKEPPLGRLRCREDWQPRDTLIPSIPC